MGKDVCRFDLLMVTEGHVDTIGMAIYTRCPNFNLHFAGNVLEAINKTRLHNPDVFVIDEAVRKSAAFRYLEEILKNRKSIVFLITGSESPEGALIGPGAALTLASTVSPDDVQRRLGVVAEELFWNKAAAARAARPREECSAKKDR